MNMDMDELKPLLILDLDQSKKKSSRDAARQRRGQQNDEYGELSCQLPLPTAVIDKLDRLCVMRLINSYIKMKHILYEIEERSWIISYKWDAKREEDVYNSFIQNALGGFVFVLAEDGQCLYVSPNVCEFLGLQQLELTGHSIYKYVHPCDQENLASQLGGNVPLADMEIFDGLFCSDTPPHLEKLPKQARRAFEGTAHRSFFLRMKSTLTSRGKSVNLNASIHRVVQCTGTMQMCRMKRGISNSSITRCFIGIGTPLLCTTTFEVPIDKSTFITKHSLDMRLISIEEIGSNMLGYSVGSLQNKSWYIYCHVCDVHVLKECHDAVLKQGQSVSAYYRVMVNQGGWMWLQTKANVVYSSSTRMPTYIICTQYLISGVELEDKVLSLDQLAHLTSKKRSLQTEESDEIDVSPMSPPYAKAKTEAGSPVYEYNFPKKEVVKTECPPLEDATTGISSKKELLARCPWIPYPFHDAEIKQFSSLDDPVPPAPDLPGLNSNETSRATGVSIQTIDRILSFDDLSFPDLSETYQDLDFGEAPATTSEQSFEEFVDFDNLQELVNANVAPHFMFKEEILKDDIARGNLMSNDPIAVN